MCSISNYMSKKETKVKAVKVCKECKSTNVYKTLTGQYLNSQGVLVKETKSHICYACYVDLLGGIDI